MDCTATRLAYKDLGYFSKIILDYLDQNSNLLPFFNHPVSKEGLASAIKEREGFATDRKLLVEGLKKQYQSLPASSAVNENLDKLAQENSFTITTAHQPVIFTGTLYFIYKILHTIKLAEQLTKDFPGKNFVPVFFMGSEDADLDELGHIYMGNEKLVWETKQKGAVGRMNNKGLEKIIAKLEGELSIHPFGKELITLLKESYLNSPDIQTATLKLLHTLFAEYGLIVFIPDNSVFKKALQPVFEEDLFSQTSSKIVEKTINQLSEHYKVQAQPRAINLFYLKEDIRERIEKKGEQFVVNGTKISFSEVEMKAELLNHPERFSPNVILRGIMQETLLPNIAFIGGGGEMAYWLELKGLFNHYKVPYPVLILRNSFLIIEKKWKERIHKLGLTEMDIFKPLEQLINQHVKKNSANQLSLGKEKEAAIQYYDKLKLVSSQIDITLKKHVESLEKKAIHHIDQLEKKILKAEKRKFEDQQRQIQSLKAALFPFNNLQERIENFMPYYAKWGHNFISLLYQYSLSIEQEFIVLEEN